MTLFLLKYPLSWDKGEIDMFFLTLFYPGHDLTLLQQAGWKGQKGTRDRHCNIWNISQKFWQEGMWFPIRCLNWVLRVEERRRSRERCKMISCNTLGKKTRAPPTAIEAELTASDKVEMKPQEADTAPQWSSSWAPEWHNKATGMLTIPIPPERWVSTERRS